MTPENKKYAIYGIAIIGLAGVAYLIFKKSDNSGSMEDPTGNGTSTPTTSHFNAKNIADALRDAMSELGTDEDAILSILKYVTPVQFSAVKIAFGTKQYNTVTGNQYNFNPFTQLPFVDLKGWLKSELSSQEYHILRSKYPKDL